MLQCFYPDRYIRSAYEIDYEAYYRAGYRGIIFDIDNTLVEHGAPADARSIALMEQLKQFGFKIMLLSNNKEPRVKMFNDAVQVSYIFKAGKPKVAGYEKAMEVMGTRRENTIFVGDQIFTDVLGANLKRLKCIFVFPIAHEQTRFFRFKRRMEVPFLPRQIYEEEKG